MTISGLFRNLSLRSKGCKVWKVSDFAAFWPKRKVAKNPDMVILSYDVEMTSPRPYREQHQTVLKSSLNPSNRGVWKTFRLINSSTSWRVERRGTDAKLFPSISWSTSKEGKSSCWTRVRTSVEYWKCACSPGKVIIGAKFPFLGWKSAQQTELKSSRKVGQFCWDLNCRQSVPQMEQINSAGPEMAKTVLLKTTFCVDNTSRSCWLY